MCRDGETMLCGGLTLDEQTVQMNKTPVLGDIPVLGKLFRWSSKSNKTSDMAFLITPHMIGDETGASLVGVGNLIKESAPELKPPSKQTE
jgi:type II secretory pathway component GspD/PulD (secretin)